MSIIFNAWEIFEVAEEIERNGAEFYRKAANSIENPDTRSRLLELAEWEARHEVSFATIKNGLSERERQHTVWDPENKDALYLQAMADGHVFNLKTDPFEKLGNKENPEDILKAAIALEKEAMTYFLGLRALVPARMGKDIVDTIIEEEMGHIGILNQELAALK
ncbi:MAG: ferritin family protein [Candidatus Fermentibacteraceae bacterium]|nr:ferritin family protein [Candidatus Fermentibacteraceae bacterium]